MPDQGIGRRAEQEAAGEALERVVPWGDRFTAERKAGDGPELPGNRLDAAADRAGNEWEKGAPGADAAEGMNQQQRYESRTGKLPVPDRDSHGQSCQPDDETWGAAPRKRRERLGAGSGIAGLDPAGFCQTRSP